MCITLEIKLLYKQDMCLHAATYDATNATQTGLPRSAILEEHC